MDHADTVLDVRGLTTAIDLPEGAFNAIEDVSFTIRKGRVLGIVGESGSGKSTVAYSIMRLLDHPARLSAGTVMFEDHDLCRLPERDFSRIRGNRISMIFQDPMMTLNPVLTVGTQIIETIRRHRQVTRSEAVDRALAALSRVGIADGAARMRAYPHEFSGGMRQRVAIAIALVNEPDLIIADEPTTALDVTIQSQILSEVQAICRERETALLWISHDLSVISGLADDVAVMYAGRLIEYGPSDEVLMRPVHPYTEGLLRSIPTLATPRGSLRAIPGTVPRPGTVTGCAFQSRCGRATDRCRTEPEPRAHDARVVACHHPVL